MNNFELRFPSDPIDAGWHEPLEAALNGLAEAAAMEVSVRVAVQLALVEAINNMIEHAYDSIAGQPIEVRGSADAERLVIELRDRGRPMPLPLPDGTPPPDDADCGRGWVIIRATFPEVRYDRVDGENRLTLIRPL